MSEKGIQNQKKSLRRKMVTTLANISSQEKQDKTKQIWRQLAEMPEFKTSQHVLGYWSFGTEVATHDFLTDMLDSRNVSLPVIKDDVLVVKSFSGISNMKAEPKFGILEPQGAELNDLRNINIVIVPGLAFDKNGGRLGRGKGYYDKLLPLLPQALMVGVCFEEQLVPSIPMDEHDKPLQKVIFA